MLVQWTTRDMGKPMVRWGTRSGELTSTAPARTDTYTRGDMCGGVANSTGYINPGLFHTAKMSGLQPDTRHFYAYGDEVISGSVVPTTLGFWPSNVPSIDQKGSCRLEILSGRGKDGAATTMEGTELSG